MGEIRNENPDLIFDLKTEEKLSSSLKNLLKRQPLGSNKTFELKGHSSILFANLAAITLASCGGGGSDTVASPVIPTAGNATPNMGQDWTFDFVEDNAGTFSIGAPTDADGNDSALTITVLSIPTGGVLTTSEGTILTTDMTLAPSLLEGLTFTPNANANSDADDIGTLILRVTDSSGSSDSATFTFVVTAVNDLPTNISITASSIAENVAGIAVGTISSDDPDLDNTFTLSGTDADKFELSGTTLKLKDTVTADYETQSSYSVVVTATDSATSISETFTISVADSIEPETVSGIVIDGFVAGSTVKLLDANGDVVATAITDANGAYTLNAADNKGVRVVADGGTDSYTGETVTITLSASKASKFVSALTTLVDVSGGDAATVIAYLDLPADFNLATDNPLEVLEVQKVNAMLINIIAVGESLLEGAGITDAAGDELIVLQMIESIKAGKDISESSVVTEILTNSAIGTVAATRVSELAADVSTSIVNANELVDAATDVTGIAIVQKVVLDNDSGITFTVKTIATGTSVYTPQTTTQLTTSMDTADIAGNQAPIDIKLSGVSVSENSLGAVLGTLSTTDPDAGETFTYTLAGTDAASFELVGSTLKLKDTISSDFETKTSYAISLTATDSGSNTRTEEFTISVTNVNESPTAVALSASSFAENSAGATIGTVSSTDPDAGETFTYALSGTDAASFEIVGSSLRLKDSIATDFETKSSYSITITTSDSGGNTKSSDFTISVTDANESPTAVALSASSFAENSAGATIGTVSSTDPDAGETFTYALSGTDAASFEIVGSTLKLKDSVSGDYETKTSYSVIVTATDSGGLTKSQSFALSVTDVEDGPTLPKGQAIDGYLVGATVWHDVNGNGTQDDGEPSTTTDITGAFTLDATLAEGDSLYVKGGYDLGTGKPNDHTFKLTVSSAGAEGGDALIVSPVSTQVSRAYAKSGVTLDQALAKIAEAYGLDETFPDLTNFDPIALAYGATTDAEAKAALTAQAKNIMVTTLGEVSVKVSEYFTTSIAPTVRKQITDIFEFGTQTLRYSSWDSNVDLKSQPRISIELEGFEALLAQASETFNDKIIEAILASEDLDNLFEMKKDGTGQFDLVITNAVDAIVLEIKNVILSEMGFDVATGYTSFIDLANYTGETVTFLGATKTMGEWAVLMNDVLDSQEPHHSADGKVHFGPDGGVTDMVGKYFAEQMSKMARLIEDIFGTSISEMTDDQLDQIVDMGMTYNRASTFDESYTRWVPFDEYGQELWEQEIRFQYNQDRFRFDSDGNQLQGNSGQWQLTADQVKAYLKDPSIQITDGNWGNEFTTYNWQITSGDLGLYLALAEARNETEVATLMTALTATDDGIELFKAMIDAFFAQGATLFKNLVTAALDFTLDKFTEFVDKSIKFQNDEIWLPSNADGLPVSTVNSVTVNGTTYELTTSQGLDWLVNAYGQMNLKIEEAGNFTFAITGGADAARFRIDDQGTLSFKDTRPSNTTDQYGNKTIVADDSNQDGVYLVEVTITEGDFSQVAELELKIPQWGDMRTSSSNYPTLDPAQQVITVQEHSVDMMWYMLNEHDPETNTNTQTQVSQGYKLNITGQLTGEQTFINLRHQDEAGNAIKDNSLFWINQEMDEQGNQAFYLNFRNDTFDFDNPSDANGDNVYELILEIRTQTQGGGDQVTTSMEILVVVEDGPDPVLSWPSWIVDNRDNPDWYHSQFYENQAAVASVQEVTVKGKTIETVFGSGQPVRLTLGDNATIVDADDRTQDLVFPREGTLTYSITGGDDAAQFVIFSNKLVFTERPVFASPADADGDNVYEVEVTISDGNSSISELFRIKIGDKNHPDNPNPSDPLEPSDPQVFTLTESAERVGNAEAVRKVYGTSNDDFIKINPHTYQAIYAGAGDDVIDPGRDWGGHGYLVGGEGADIFIFRPSYGQQVTNFGIRDHANWDPTSNKDGISGHDENRDGVLDLATEVHNSWVPLIADFTPGVDKIGLGASSWTGFNRTELLPSEISFQQGTGELAAHTLVTYTGGDAAQTDEGYLLLGVLLNTTATDVSSSDIVSVGSTYETVLGKFDIGATTVEIAATDGTIIKVQQLPNGLYLWFNADSSVRDNELLHQNFAVTTDGVMYAPRVDELDYENPQDADRDNIYEFSITAYAFTSLVIKANQWGDYQPDYSQSQPVGGVAFTVILNLNDDISDNIGNVSIAETTYLVDGAISTELVELVLKQISAVQSSMADIDFRAIAEEIGFDFEFFAMADSNQRAEEWFDDYITRSFEDFGREMEETFEQNLLSKYDDFTDANDLSNLSGDATDNTISGTDIQETIFGKAGDDTISGGAGDDVIFGDEGGDTLSGGPGSDSLSGGPGNDKLIVDEGNDILDGGAGDDLIDLTNLTSFPEFITGGSGEDTLLMAGMSTKDLTYDDNDSDGSPDYTGIDLQKVISFKETWTSTDAQGASSNEEGWRNRIESIEKIDLRDSQSAVNSSSSTAKTPIDGFRLASTSVTITDYGDENAINTHKIYTTTSGTTLNANLVGGSMDQTNLSNVVSSDSSTGKSPVLSFALDSIPSSGSSGTATVTMKLYDGSDTTQSTGERLLETTLTVNWTSDGTNIVMTLPAQTLTVNYYSSDGVLLQRTWENAESDAITFTKSVESNGAFGNLDLSIASFFSAKGSADGVDLTGFITSGDYFFEVTLAGLDIVDYNDNAFTTVQGSFTVADSPGVVAYVDDVVVDESAASATVTVNLSKAAASDVTVDYQTVDGTALAGSDYTDTSGTLTIAAGNTSGTFAIPITSDATAETLEALTVNLSGATNATLGRSSSTVTIENVSVFNDVLNITLQTLWQMSWDSRTWTIRGDSTDTVRLLGHESSYDSTGGGTASTFFEPFRFNGQETIDGVVYNVYDLWDARVLIEVGVTVVYSKRDLGKTVAGENSQPDFWYKYTTVNENQTDAYTVQNSWDQDGDIITYSIDPSFGDAALFNIDSATGEVTFKVAPDYENPTSTMASGITDFSSFDNNMMMQYNQYQVKVIGNDGSGEANATNTQTLWINVRNLPDYAGYDPTNKVPFFKEMWDDQTTFTDDATDQDVQIKGYDLDFDTLTWTLLGVEAYGEGSPWVKWGETQDGTDGNEGRVVGDAPLQLSATGVISPKSVLSYEAGYSSFQIYISITDGKSDPVYKQYYFSVKDTLDDGTLSIVGHTYIGSSHLAGATVWQDLDNDGVVDAGEPSTTSSNDGYFVLEITESATDSPILASGGVDMGSGLANNAVLKINSNLKLESDRQWGEYALSPLSTVSLAMQNLDRSISDKVAALNVYKALGFEPGWHEGDGNFYGSMFWNFQQMTGITSEGDWNVNALNVYFVSNLVNLIGQVASQGGLQIAQDVLADVNAKIASTANAAGTSSQTLTAAQQNTILAAAYSAAMEAVAELVTGLTAFDGFRLGSKNPVTITDTEGSTSVVHTPSFTVTDGVMTLNSSQIQINQSGLQAALNLDSGATGLKVEVEVGTVPASGQTIQFIGKLIDGNNSIIDSGERAIEVRFDVTVDPTKALGASDYVFVPASSDITVIYTGEDGTVTSTTVAHSGNMVTITVPESGGSPKFVVDLMEVFSRGIPETDLSTYFTTETVSNGDYYAELTFTGAALSTSAGDTFNKVIAPFKVAASTTPVAYTSDLTISESRGWGQLTVTLSKPATENFTLNYRFTGGDAEQGSDYFWWAEQSGYRQISFITGQKTAVINLDVRDDSDVESTETFNVEISVAPGSESKIILGTELVTVTIEDNDSAGASAGLDSDALVAKVLAKLESTIVTILKAITDGNSGTLDGTAATYSAILADGNSDISDISTYLAAELTEDNNLYDSIMSGVLSLVNTWVGYIRGDNNVRGGYKIDAQTMAVDLAALAKAINTLVLSEFTSNAGDAAALQAALVADIYADSGFKYNGPATVNENFKITPDRTQDSDAAAYLDIMRPAGKDYVSTQWQDRNAESMNGTSGDDTITLDGDNVTNYRVVYTGGEGDDIIVLGGNKAGVVYGGPGNDRIISDDNEQHRFDGGTGNDTLGGDMSRGTFIGGEGADVFVIEVDTGTWNTENTIEGWDNNNDLVIDFITETNSRPSVIADFEDGVDMIGLKGDWSGKTIVVAQGTGDHAAHTFLYKASAEHSYDDAQVYVVLANTTASTITADDFVLVGNDYTTSALSDVTISTTPGLAGLSLPSIAPIFGSAIGDEAVVGGDAIGDGGGGFLVEEEDFGVDINGLISASTYEIGTENSDLSDLLVEMEIDSRQDTSEMMGTDLQFNVDLFDEEDILISFDSI